MLSFLTTNSQVPCLTSQLNISTGFNPSTNSVVQTAGFSDYKWKIVGTENTPVTPPIGSSAIINNPTFYSFANHSLSSWISFADISTNGYSTSSSIIPYSFTVQRSFQICIEDSIILEMNKFARDNWIESITLNGTIIWTDPNPIGLASNFTTFSTANITLGVLSPGTYDLEFKVINESITHATNFHGLNIYGFITSATNTTSIISESDDCKSYVCEECSDFCYWKVVGNEIITGRNIFGTKTNDDVRIKTYNQNRGIFTKKGLLGWNTMVPSAFLHINCDGNNPDNGYLSDVRFERLESGEGNILVINDKGYVLDSKISIEEFNGLKKENEKLKDEIEDLKNQFSLLNNKIDQLTSNKASNQIINSDNILFQNTPNPFDQKTSIKYYVQGFNSSAFILVEDLNGKVVEKFLINKAGEGKVIMNDNKLSAGTYLYSLIIDGERIDSKKLVLLP